MLDSADRRARVTIADSGPGIPPEEMKELFRPFFRSKSRVASSSGTGLGLAIAHRIVTAHGGSITVSSETGVGTIFTITLPYSGIKRNVSRARRRRRIVIIGGVTSGPKAAARLRRLDEEPDITIIEQNEFLSYAGCQLPSFISNSIGSSNDVLSSAYRLVRSAQFYDTMRNITILNMTAAEKINRAMKTVAVRRRQDGKTFEVPYDVLVLATGSLPFIPSIPGTGNGMVYPLHSLEDAKRIKERLWNVNAQDVVVVGGGLIGISTLQSLSAIGARATVVERESTILGTYFDPDFSRRIENTLEHKGVKIATRTEVTSISSLGSGIVVHAKERAFNADLVVLSSGMRPNTNIAKACGIVIGAAGGIQVDSHLRTSDPNIFAVGDCAETSHLLTGHHEYWPLGSISVKMGRTVADVIAGKESTFRGSLGTVLLACFDLRLARTGLTTARAKEAGFEPQTYVLTGADRPGYSAVAEEIFLKVIADRGSRKILGAQAYGKGDVASKISLYATAITNSMTTDDVFDLDLGHSPDFNLPIDVVQIACLMLNNKIDGLVRTISAEEVEREEKHLTLVAITTPEVAARNMIPGSLEVNPESLRKTELPFQENDNVVLYSRNSMEAYQAYRYLVQRGYTNLRVLEGGYLFFSG
jgi:NADPH-dependent 2,4-dienoyl-CoA reductase/sulfur reductase-like enzyme/rhodanese-related sulfurtransferase